MTREVAIDNLKADIKYWENTSVSTEHLYMAIKSLEQEPCDDCVSRQAVLKELRSCLTGGEIEYQYVKLHIDSISPVLPKREQGEWTRVEDGLPEDGERVLIYADTEDAYEIAERHLVEFSEDEYEWEVFSTFGYKYALDDEDVIAWMPFPKYEGVE